MSRRSCWHLESRERIKAAENRLGRLRELIERRVRAGLDAAESWRLFDVTATALANMRQSERLLEVLHATADQMLGSGSRELATALGGADPIVFAPGEAMQATDPTCYMVQSGLVSLCFQDAHGVEVGAVGPGGIVGIYNLLAADEMPITPVATTRCQTLAVPALELAAYIAASKKALGFIHATILQQWSESTILARCNAEHSVRDRVARWVLTSSKRLGEASIAPISHDRLASLLGVRRASVTIAVEELEGERAIVAKRSAIEVRDQSALEALACECHAMLASQALSSGALRPLRSSARQ